MIDFTFIIFAFLAGIVAFFSPCSFVLLPGYMTYYISKGENKKLSFQKKIIKGLNFGFFTILGFFTVFGITGMAIILVGQVVKKFVPWISIIFGLALIIIGVAMLFGRHFNLNINFFVPKKEKAGLYLFGVTYAVAALGCVFPIFLTIALQSFAGSNLIEAVMPLIFYIIGISIVMFLVTLIIIFSRDFIDKHMKKILSSVHYISALIIIIAGAYMIYYQYILLG